MKSKNKKMSLSGVLGSSDPFFGPNVPHDNPQDITEIVKGIIKENPFLDKKLAITNFNAQSIFYNLRDITREIHNNNDLKSDLADTLANIFKKYKNDENIVNLKKILIKAKNPEDYYDNDYIIG